MLGAVDSKSKALYAMQLSKGRAGDGGLCLLSPSS